MSAGNSKDSVPNFLKEIQLELILIRDVFQLRSSLELPLKIVEGVDFD